MTEVTCELCHKPIFGSDGAIPVKKWGMSRVKYHEGCKKKVNSLRDKERHKRIKLEIKGKEV